MCALRIQRDTPGTAPFLDGLLADHVHLATHFRRERLVNCATTSAHQLVGMTYTAKIGLLELTAVTDLHHSASSRAIDAGLPGGWEQPSLIKLTESIEPMTPLRFRGDRSCSCSKRTRQRPPNVATRLIHDLDRDSRNAV
jgi:hypothetical protein